MVGKMVLRLSTLSFQLLLATGRVNLEIKMDKIMSQKQQAMLLKKIRVDLMMSDQSRKKERWLNYTITRIRFQFIQLKIAPCIELQRDIINTKPQLILSYFGRMHSEIILTRLRRRSPKEASNIREEDRRLDILIRLTTEEYRADYLRRMGLRKEKFGAFTVWRYEKPPPPLQRGAPVHEQWPEVLQTKENLPSYSITSAESDNSEQFNSSSQSGSSCSALI